MNLPKISWSRKVVAAVACACILLFIAGYELQRHVQTRAKAAVRQELSAIADLKLRQITTWREERLADARFFSQARFVAGDLKRLLAAPDSEDAQAAVTHWLSLLKRGDRYEAVVLFDGELNRLASLPSSATVPGAHVRELFDRAVATGDVALSDLHVADEDGLPRQDMLLPIYADPEVRTGAPLGVVLIRLDPHRLLYPLIQSWPTPSRTAETLIVRKEGEEVIFLNELRHRAGAAMSLRLSLGSPFLPAAIALRGETNVQEGIDYRGVRVVFVGKLVPGTSWAMIAKVDEEELYAPSRQQTLVAVLVICSVVLATTLVAGVFWQQRNARLLAQIHVQATALASAANGIVITRPDGTIEWVNPAFTQLTGYTAGEVLGKKTNILRSGKQDRQAYQEMWETILAGRPWHGELINKRKDGTLYDEELTITPVADGTGRIAHFVAIKQDVTRRKEAEVQQARTRDELEQLVARRTTLLRETVDELEHFSFSITHDMRAPLRAMNNYAVLLERKFGPLLPAEGLGFLSRIQTAAVRLDNLIRDSLNYSKALRLELPMRAVDLGPLLRGIIDSYPNLQPTAADIAIEFESQVVRGNEAALTQCFSNLLGNAVKFVSPGVKPRIRVTAEERHAPAAPPVVRVCVHDNGIGIPPGSQQSIFGMFQRLHGPNEYPGTGIGLALVRKAVQRMGGSVGVSSESEQGSVFWIELKIFSSNATSNHPAS